MTRVDFYLLDKKPQLNRYTAICQITQKIYQLGHKSRILTENEAETRKIDALLWTFQPGSFIPHLLHSEQGQDDVAVVIGSEPGDAGGRAVLISLKAEIPSCCQDYSRVVEVVGQHDDEKQQARERYRQYNNSGYELHTHEL